MLADGDEEDGLEVLNEVAEGGGETVFGVENVSFDEGFEAFFVFGGFGGKVISEAKFGFVEEEKGAVLKFVLVRGFYEFEGFILFVYNLVKILNGLINIP